MGLLKKVGFVGTGRLDKVSTAVSYRNNREMSSNKFRVLNEVSCRPQLFRAGRMLNQPS